MIPYHRFVAASGMTNLADGMAVVAWAWLASLLTRDAVLLALVPVALRMPWFLFALPAGIVTDRVDRLRLIVAMDALRAGVFLLAAGVIWGALPLGVAPVAGVSHAWLYEVILVAALVVGGAEVFRDNAAQTMLPVLVGHGDLERANGRLWSVELLSNALVGPALGAQAYGLVLAGGAVGGIPGSLLGARIATPLGPARTMQWMLASSVPSFVALALAPIAVTLGIVIAVFEWAGLTWNVVSVSMRQRMIPDALLGRVNSLYRLMAWGMMPVGLVVSGVIVRLAEGVVAREVALVMPFWAAGLGALMLTGLAWGALGRGFAGLGRFEKI